MAQAKNKEFPYAYEIPDSPDMPISLWLDIEKEIRKQRKIDFIKRVIWFCFLVPFYVSIDVYFYFKKLWIEFSICHKKLAIKEIKERIENAKKNHR